MQFIRRFSEIGKDDLPSVGGKGLNLGKLTKAGFSVPQGFCVCTDAYRFSVQDLPDQNMESLKSVMLASELTEAILKARKELRTDTVAVRSSATAEDLDDASFAGQQDTFLNVTSDGILDALKACWASLWSERAIAYRQTQGIPNKGLAMAVVVQEMCAADVSGVLFTVSPFNENVSIVESNWGLGESVVSGEITPDSFQISRETGEVLERTVAIKQEMITAAGVSEVSSAQQNIPSLTDDQLKQLWQLGIQVEILYKQPMDIEWALADGKFVLLQARPITTRAQEHVLIDQKDGEIEKLRQAEIQILETLADTHGTVWSHHNLAEVLPAPLPMTWAIIRKFMSGSGGLGKAYQGLGFYPSKSVENIGILDLICARIYVNLNREAKLFFEGFPYAHDFTELKQKPQKAMYAQAMPNIKHATSSFWFKLPIHIIRMTKAELRLRKCRADFDQVLTEQEFPKFREIVEAEQNLSYSELSDAELVKKFKEWWQKTLYDFAPKALTATLLAAFSLQRLEAVLQKCIDETEAKGLASRLVSGLSGNLTVETNEKLQQVASGQFSLTDFLNDYGHRTVNEFELAQPRWREDTTYLEQIIASFSQQDLGSDRKTHEDDQHFTRQMEQREAAEKELAEVIEDKPRLQKQIESELDFTRRYMPFRETAKFYLMLGYEQIRRALVELDNRYTLNGGIFYLVPDELDQLIDGEEFGDVIAERRVQRELLLQIEIPDVIFSDSLDCIGAALPTDVADTYTGVGVSAGTAKGQARVLLKPSDIQPLERDYILVCPSTDPAWTPLFLHAAGLVMERGGLLSHGAVVAREYGVPAVANIPHATQNITDGQMLQVDGNHGTVSIIST
ncbi:MAG: PEP-utilizing enzyme [Candidatus Poribacteria bacterium]|nr:PEP-utilizing enzyme [Candidatus Poribacteria bacterium]